MANKDRQPSFSMMEFLQPRPLRYLSDYLQSLVKGRLWLKVLIAMFLGFGAGMLLGPTVGWFEARTANAISSWLALPGQLFLALIQMIVIPLVFASVVRGLAAGEGPEGLRRTGVRAIGFFLGSTVLAICIGIVLAVVIQPGSFVSSEVVISALGQQMPKLDAGAGAGAAPSLSEIPTKIVTLLPSNPLTSMVENNMIQVVLFAVVVGLALVAMVPAQSKPMLDLLGSLQEVCMTVVRYTMRLAPLAVFGLMAQLSSKIGINALLGLMVYVGTVILGLFILLLVFLFIVALLRIKVSRFLSSAREVLLLAFSTSSSAAVMPLSIKTVEDKFQVRPAISQLVIPLGATINMNGTALYQGVAALFLAQVFGIDITLGSMVLLVVMAVGASVGSPATPGVGIVILATILASIGIPPAGIALIMGVDRLLDMCRTAINVCGDLVACLVMERFAGHPEPEQQPAMSL